MGLLIITCAVIGVVMLIMAVGVIFSGRCIQGSCGGELLYGPNGELLNCESCPARDECKAETSS